MSDQQVTSLTDCVFYRWNPGTARKRTEHPLRAQNNRMTNLPIIYRFFSRIYRATHEIIRSRCCLSRESSDNRYFYKYTPPRPLEEIEADVRAVEQDIVRMLAEVTGSRVQGV